MRPRHHHRLHTRGRRLIPMHKTHPAPQLPQKMSGQQNSGRLATRFVPGAVLIVTMVILARNKQSGVNITQIRRGAFLQSAREI